ncbi:ATP-dependent zinc metalloprotease FTSH 12, chloroplastic [Olea europaea subsp. europaea]|uniref:ATP-dependent zinc metalloprotease FTSH 12, chloroplastic n=1 Tax=Olea europaea subsp. europaea TaxID=158383 RepID=A0A8S0R2R6_OLEEU|nr:ATP-dependent zinc metalloprotease FTSH 12, chloroplastic [Olea europaea subsp. europaea]
MYKDVVLGGDVWDLLDELMIYMGNPMQYYEKDMKFVRVSLYISKIDEAIKVCFSPDLQDARTLAKESGLPFVFASGAEFTNSEKSGAARINELFSIARRKLDGEKERTGVDRFSLRQAVIFICATNRPDEMDLEFVCPGRTDRCVYIRLPDAKQRVQNFCVHSVGKELAEDVDFEKLVFQTVGYSGADIRNLVNEARIMSVRKGHSKIYQQDIVNVLDKQLLEETAVSVFYPREDMVDQGYTIFSCMQMQMVVAHGGHCAERIVFGDEITNGKRDDLEKITKIAREMVISLMNHRLGLTALTKRIGLVDRPDNPDVGRSSHHSS